MQYITEIDSYQSEQSSAVTLGKFDGLHRGHQKLIDKIREYASDDVKSIVCAFDMGKESLLTGEERKERLSSQVDCLIACPFTKEIREMEAEEFIRKILVERLHASHIVVGTDFHFGHGKRGDVKMLEEFAPICGYQLDVIEKEKYSDRPLVTMSMGKDGVVSRICGECFGSDITFAAVGKTSAPGQIEAEDLKRILEVLG